VSKFEPCSRCGKLRDTESPSDPDHDCETPDDRISELELEIEQLRERVERLEAEASLFVERLRRLGST
jgi:predicted nuclease with TOPRIM domain